MTPLPVWGQESGCRTTHCNLEVLQESTLVFLATKPHVLPGVLQEIRPAVGPHHVVVSLAAGVTLQTLQRVSCFFLLFLLLFLIPFGEGPHPHPGCILMDRASPAIPTSVSGHSWVLPGAVTPSPIPISPQLLPAGTKVLRLMPNLPCVVQAGAMVFARGSGAGDGEAALLKSLLSSCGLCEEVPESYINIHTGLSGSGVAYVSTYTQRDMGR